MKKFALFVSAFLLLSVCMETGFIFEPAVAHAAPEDAIALQPAFYAALNAAGVDANHDGRITEAEMAVPPSLEIIGINITDLSGIEYATGLKTLVITGTGITGLPAGFSNLTGLTSLELSNNDNLTSVPSAVLGLTGLKILRLQMNAITSLPEGIGGLTGLQELNLYYNGLASLPDSIGSLTNLTGLFLQKNHLAALPDSIGNLSNLTELTVWDNWLTGLPEGAFGGMAGLAALDLSNNYFNPGDLPEGIPAFAVVAPQKTYAVSLNYNGGTGAALPKSRYYYGESVTLPAASKPGYTFSGWDTDGNGTPDKLPGNTVAVEPSPVTASSVVYNAIYGYTVTFAAQPYGTIGGGTADIRETVNPGGKVSAVPTAAADSGYTFLGWFDGNTPVTEAQILGMVINANKTFTARFEAVGTIHFADAAFKTALAVAGADENGDGFITQSEMSLQTSLTLSGGQFTDIAGIGYAVNLESLSLGSGNVSSLPAELFNLTNLKSLNIGGNPVAPLPASIGNLTNLETLDIGGCGFSSLPPEIAALTTLKNLDASGNRFAAFPEALEGMAGLTGLNLSGNLLTGLPAGCFDGMTGLASLDLRLNYFNPGGMPANTPGFAIVSPQKTYAITLDFNRGTGDALPKSGYCRGETIPLPDASRFDYDFIGWDADGDGTADTAGAGTVTLSPDPPNSISAKTYRAVYVCRSARLTGIVLTSGASLSPAFDLDTLAYNVYLPNTVASVTVKPSTTNGSAFTINGEAVASKAVPVPPGGKATVAIACAQPGKSNATYTVNIYRIAPVTAMRVSAGALSPAFAVASPNYTVSIPAVTESVTVTPIKAGSCTGMTIDGKTAVSKTLYPPAGGSATAVIRATAANGKVFTYSVKVVRAAMITGIKASPGALSPAFNPAVASYTVNVAATVSKVKVTPAKARTGVKYVTINGKKASYAYVKPPVGGSASAAIRAYGTDGRLKATYTVTVRRAALVKNIAVSTGTLAFSSGTYSYVVNIPADTPSVKVSAAGMPGIRSLTNSRPTLSPQPGGSAATVITAVASDRRTKSSYTVTVRRAPIIAGIRASGGALSPAFNTAVRDYTVNLPASADAVTLTATPAGVCSALTMDGYAVTSKTVKPAIGGSVKVTIAGKTAAGTTVTYTVRVNRAALVTKIYSGSKAYPISPAFNPTTLNYTIALPATVKSVTVRAAKAKSGVAYMTMNGRKATSVTVKPPVGGSVPVYVAAAAPNGKSVTYTVTVVRRPLVSNIEAIGGGSPGLAFNPSKPSYTVNVPADTASVTIKPTRGSNVRSITINGAAVSSLALKPPVGGSATAVIAATATDRRTKSTYTVTVRRAPIVTGISVTGGQMALSPAFSPTTLAYTVNVPATCPTVTLTPAKGADCSTLLINGGERDSITLDAPAVGGSATVTVTGRTALGAAVTYTVRVNRIALVAAIASGNPSCPLTPAFNPATAAYEINLPAEVSSVVITAAKTASAKYLRVNGAAVASCTAAPPAGGSVTVTITATAADGMTASTYTVVVNRAS